MSTWETTLSQVLHTALRNIQQALDRGNEGNGGQHLAKCSLESSLDILLRMSVGGMENALEINKVIVVEIVLLQFFGSMTQSTAK